MFGARAQASCQMANIVVVMSKIFSSRSQLYEVEEGRHDTYYFTTILLAQGSRDQRADLWHILLVHMPSHCFEVYSPRILV